MYNVYIFKMSAACTYLQSCLSVQENFYSISLILLELYTQWNINRVPPIKKLALSPLMLKFEECDHLDKI